MEGGGRLPSSSPIGMIHNDQVSSYISGIIRSFLNSYTVCFSKSNNKFKDSNSKQPHEVLQLLVSPFGNVSTKLMLLFISSTALIYIIVL